MAEVAHAKREVLLRAYHGWLRRADLEDCFSQATLELLLRARRGGGFESRVHIAHALEQKLCSRIHDRRRALTGRSAIEAALEGALSLGEPSCSIELADVCAPVHERVSARLRLRSLLRQVDHLSADQRLALACQVALGMGAEEFCRRFGWSREKHRKVLQRGRARLRRVAEREEGGELGQRAKAGARASGPARAVETGPASDETEAAMGARP